MTEKTTKEKQSTFAASQATDTAPAGGGEFRKASAISGRTMDTSPGGGSASGLSTAMGINDRGMPFSNNPSGAGTGVSRGVNATLRAMPFSTGPRTKALPPTRDIVFQDRGGRGNSVIPNERGMVFGSLGGSVASDAGGGLVSKAVDLVKVAAKSFMAASAPRNETAGQPHGASHSPESTSHGPDSAPMLERALDVGARNSEGSEEHVVTNKQDARCQPGEVYRNGKCVSIEKSEEMGLAATMAEEDQMLEKASLEGDDDLDNWMASQLSRVFS